MPQKTIYLGIKAHNKHNDKHFFGERRGVARASGDTHARGGGRAAFAAVPGSPLNELSEGRLPVA